MFNSKNLFALVLFVGLALLPLVSGSYGVDLVSKIMVYAIFALSLELLVGATGLVCFGQAAFFGIGAYAAVLWALAWPWACRHWQPWPLARCRCAPRACTSSW